jgi:peptidoglycan hydrolase CwlO-like protein
VKPDERREMLAQLQAELAETNAEILRCNETIAEAERLREVAQARAIQLGAQIVDMERSLRRPSWPQ